MWIVNHIQSSKKKVELELLNNNGQVRRASTFMNRKAKEIIVFSQQTVANKFTQELLNNQKVLIRNMLTKLQINNVFE